MDTVEGAADSRGAPLPGWLLLAGTGLAGALLLASLAYPLTRDHGNLGWVGDVIAGGGMPYLDAWEIKGPVAYLPFALGAWSFPGATWPIRAFEVVLVLAGALALRAVARPVLGAGAAWAALLWVLWHAGAGASDTAQVDGWAAIATLLGLACLGPGHGRLGRLAPVLAGGLVGLAAGAKPFFIALLVPLYLGLPPAESADARGWNAATLVGGAALAVALPLAWLGASGGLREAIEIFFEFLPGQYVAVPGLTAGYQAKQLALVTLLNQRLGGAFLLAGLGAWRLRRERQEATLVLALWLAVGVGLVALQGKYFPYHWASMWPPLAVLAVAGLQELRERLAGGGLRHFATGMAVVVVVAAGVGPAGEVGHVGRYLAGGITRAQYLARYSDRVADVAALEALAAYVRDRTAPGDGLFMWGRDGAPYVLARRYPPTRLAAQHMSVSSEGEYSLKAAYREEMLRDLQADPPAYLAIADDDDVWFIHPSTSREYLATFFFNDTATTEIYTPATRFGALELLRRTDFAARGAGGLSLPGSGP
jgi:hypothetical protein